MTQRVKQLFKILKQIEKQHLDINVMLNCFPYGYYKQAWDQLSEDPQLTDDMIKKYNLWLNWNILSGKHNFSLDMLKQWEDKINWVLYSSNEHITIQIARYYKDKLNWFNVAQHIELTKDICREFNDVINFSYLIRNNKLSLDIINQFKDKFDLIDFHYLSYQDILTDDFIQKNLENLILCQVQKHCVNKKLKKHVHMLSKFKYLKILQI